MTSPPKKIKKVDYFVPEDFVSPYKTWDVIVNKLNELIDAYNQLIKQNEKKD